jgi:hypothetical protein
VDLTLNGANLPLPLWMKTRKRLPALSLSFLLRRRQGATPAPIPKEPSCQSLCTLDCAAACSRLGVTCEEIDERIGFAPRYANKLLSSSLMKNMGTRSLGPMLAALGIELVSVERRRAIPRPARSTPSAAAVSRRSCPRS